MLSSYSYCTYNSLKAGLENKDIKFGHIRYAYKGLIDRCYLLNDVFVLHWCVQSFHNKITSIENKTRSTVFLCFDESMGKNDYLYTAVDVRICPVEEFKKHWREYFEGTVIPLFDADIGGLTEEEVSRLDDALYSVIFVRPHLWDSWFTWFVDNTVNKLMDDGIVIDWRDYRKQINYPLPTENPAPVSNDEIAFYDDSWAIMSKSYVTDYGLKKTKSE